MADVRAMLRSELASRKPSESGSKKRKATTEHQTKEHKKAKNQVEIPPESESLVLPSRSSPVQDAVGPDMELQTTKNSKVENNDISEPPVVEPPISQAQVQAIAENDVNEDEWAAFDRDIATLPTEEEETAGETARPQVLSALNAPATISAQPLSAAAIAAQAREEQSVQRGRRDTEREEEKEEAAQQLQDEFEEMEGLEERVRRLKEKREALRRGSQSQNLSNTQEQRPDVVSVAEKVTENQTTEGNGDRHTESEDEEDDDEEEDEQWSLWRR